MFKDWCQKLTAIGTRKENNKSPNGWWQEQCKVRPCATMHGAAGGITNPRFCQHHPAQGVHPSLLTLHQASAGRFHLAPFTLRQTKLRRPTLVSSTGLVGRRGAQELWRAIAPHFDNSWADVDYIGAGLTGRTQRLWKKKQQKCCRGKRRVYHPSHRTQFAAGRAILSSGAIPGGTPEGRLPCGTAPKPSFPPTPSSSGYTLRLDTVPSVASSSSHNRSRVATGSLARDNTGPSKEAPEAGNSNQHPQQALGTSRSAELPNTASQEDNRVDRAKKGKEGTNHPGRLKQTSTRKQKQKFKRARFAEIAPEEARAVLASQYSAAQGIPYRAPEEFRLWVQLMMAGPEHVILSEPGDYIFQNGERTAFPVSHMGRFEVLKVWSAPAKSM